MTIIHNIGYKINSRAIKTMFKKSPSAVERLQRELSQDCSACRVCFYPVTCARKGAPVRNGHKLLNTKDEMLKTMDIRSNAMYPANVLSNLTQDPFVFDGVNCSSVEGFLQSLKVKNIEEQIKICSGWGASARKKGHKNKEWMETQTLYWMNKPYKRDSKEYQELLKKVYEARFNQSALFRYALKNSKGYTLTHSIGKENIADTILTKDEFTNILSQLQAQV